MTSLLGIERRRLFLRGGAWTIEALGGSLAFVILVFLLTHPEPMSVWVLDLAVGLTFPVLLVYAGYRLDTADLSPVDRWRVAGWTVFGFVLASGFGAWQTYRRLPESGIAEGAYLVLTVGALGALIGLFGSVGILQARHSEPRSLLPLNIRFVGGTGTPVVDEISVGRGEHHRLLLLQYLQQNSARWVSVDELTDYLAGETHSETTQKPRAVLRAELEHIHLPRLTDAGLVSYDPDQQIARYTFPETTSNSRSTTDRVS